jgi:hypothetical protein
MTDLVLRLVKGSPLTNSEVDNNFSNINITKVEIGGDLSGTYSVPIVARIQSRNVANIVPADGQALVWSNGTSSWVPGTVASSSGNAKVSIGDNAPGSPTNGDLWWNSNVGTLYIYYMDSNSSQWVESFGAGWTGYTEGGGSGGANIGVFDTSTANASFYPTFVSITSGNISAANISSTKLYFNPNTGTLNSTVFNSLSDITLKENVIYINSSLDILKHIEGVSFTWKDSGRKSYGVIAQELEKYIPELVEGIDKKSVNYSGIIPFLINAVKELDERVRYLEGK